MLGDASQILKFVVAPDPGCFYEIDGFGGIFFRRDVHGRVRVAAPVLHPDEPPISHGQHRYHETDPQARRYLQGRQRKPDPWVASSMSDDQRTRRADLPL